MARKRIERRKNAFLGSITLGISGAHKTNSTAIEYDETTSHLVVIEFKLIYPRPLLFFDGLTYAS